MLISRIPMVSSIIVVERKRSGERHCSGAAGPRNAARFECVEDFRTPGNEMPVAGKRRASDHRPGLCGSSDRRETGFYSPLVRPVHPRQRNQLESIQASDDAVLKTRWKSVWFRSGKTTSRLDSAPKTILRLHILNTSRRLRNIRPRCGFGPYARSGR